ncbi:helix-turn-helix transcriptional regulator [Burkholderia cepacia]|uniref:helix-turn-helix transcriptional regulator n=1 Tax=Burkholderia cepacia TaxID=292 RepID=UPI0009C0D3C9|nr:LuxR C-terminal-related transcriptional regulator [Burkholderia cepacia]
MKHLLATDLQAWLTAITHPLAEPESIVAWLEGPLRSFFPYSRLFLGYGELVAGQLKINHIMAIGHSAEYLDKIERTSELNQRGALQWWFANRRPFVIDLSSPPPYVSDYELREIEDFRLVNVAGHGVLNAKLNTGTYFGFSGVKTPLSQWHIEALKLIAPVLNDLFLGYLAQKELSINSTHLFGRANDFTPRERDIVRLIASGMSDKAIARALGTSDKTVRNQLTKIYSRLGVSRRSDLMLLLR